MSSKIYSFIIFYIILFFSSNAFSYNGELIKLFNQTNKQVHLINKEINGVATIGVQTTPDSLNEFQVIEENIKKIISTLELKKTKLGLKFDQYNKETKKIKKRFLFIILDDVTKSYYETIRMINSSINLANKKLASTSNNKSQSRNLMNLTSREKKVLNYFSADSVNDVSSKEMSSLGTSEVSRTIISSEEVYEVNKETQPFVIINN